MAIQAPNSGNPSIVDVVDAVSAKPTTSLYRNLSMPVSERDADPAQVAAQFLADQDLA